MLTRDIHSQKESVDTALYDLEESIRLARFDKDKILCVIVGYGSTGKTHKIKTACLKHLEELKNNKKIKEYILGSDLDIFNINYQSLKYKDRIPNNVKKTRNPGAIYVIL